MVCVIVSAYVGTQPRDEEEDEEEEEEEEQHQPLQE